MSWPKSSFSNYSEMHLALKLHSAILTSFHFPPYGYRESGVNSLCVRPLFQKRTSVTFYTYMERPSSRNLSIKSINYNNKTLRNHTSYQWVKVESVFLNTTGARRLEGRSNCCWWPRNAPRWTGIIFIIQINEKKSFLLTCSDISYMLQIQNV